MKLTIKTLILFVALIVAPLCGGNAASIYDDFNDNVTNAALWNVGATGTGVTTSEVNQRVEVSIPGGVTDPLSFGGSYGSVAVFSGDIDVAVSFDLLQWPATNGVRAVLNIQTVGPGLSYWVVERVSGGGANQFGEVYLTDFNSSVGSYVNTGDASGALRISRSGDTVSAYYLAAGNWQFLRSTQVDPLRDLVFGFGAFSSDQFFGDQAVQVAFDDVAMVPLPTAIIAMVTGLLSLAGFGHWRSRTR